jgi:hypothetical protein
MPERQYEPLTEFRTLLASAERNSTGSWHNHLYKFLRVLDAGAVSLDAFTAHDCSPLIAGLFRELFAPAKQC